MTSLDYPPMWILWAIVAAVNAAVVGAVHWMDVIPIVWVAAGYGYSWGLTLPALFEWQDWRRAQKEAPA